MSTVVHTIRLHAGWMAEPLPTGGVRHTRHFGMPRTLDETETAWLVLTTEATVIAVVVNDFSVSLPANVTKLLKARNKITVDVQDETPLGAMVMEIRTTSS